MSNKYNENFDNMIYIKIIQKFFINYLRFNEIKKSLLDQCLYIKEIISDLMVHLNNCYDLQIINNESYTDYNQDLEKILNDINELQNITSSNRYYYIKSRFFQLCKLKNKFFKDLQKLYLNFGSLSIIKLINYDINNDLLFENYSKEFIDNLFFYNKILVPLKLSIFNNLSPKNEDKIKINESKDLVISKNIKSNEYFLDKNFIENINISIPVLLPTLKDSNINNIYKLLIPLKEHKLIIKGYLHRDSLSIFRDHPIVNNRLKNLTNNLNLKLIDYSFYNNYLKQIM